MTDRLDLDRLVAGADLPSIVRRYVPALKPNGKEFEACCPFHEDRSPSFNLFHKGDKWRWICHAGCGRGDVLDFLQMMDGTDRITAIKQLRGELGMPERAPTPAPRAEPEVEWTPVLPVPDEAPELDPGAGIWNPKRGRATPLRPTLTHAYRDANGRLLGYVLRCDFEDGPGRQGGKWTPTVTACVNAAGERAWCLVPFPRQRPLYGLDLLAAEPTRPVMVVEGEKAADAGRRLLGGWVVVTWPGGTNGVAHADWSPLKGRDVVIWPDADAPGIAACHAIGAALTGHAARVRWIDPAGQPDGFDAADTLAAGWTPARLQEWARPRVRAWEPPSNDPPPVAAPARPARPQLATVDGNAVRAPKPQPEPDADEAIPPQFSDDALALRFTRKHGDDLRYVATWGRWYRWTGVVWAEDSTYHAFDRARALCRAVAHEVGDDPTLPPNKRDTIAKAITSAKTIAAVVKLAQADRKHAATVDQWDRDPWILNTPGGLVDLHTGETRPHDPEAYCTKVTAVAPGGGCPVWRAFLLRAMGGDASMVTFLQRVAGYALTGSTREHAMFFAYGTGGNGKGTWLNTLTRIMADYARTAPMEAFAEARGDRHPTELAMLRGARLVVAQETEEGQRWAEARIKALTGGDPISARFMRQDFFEYLPQFKLVIAGNHKPALRAPDEAIRRRFNLIPFDQTIPAEERDPDLAERLWAEAPGILAWAIEGCTDYLERRLAPPERVTAATAEYMVDEDPLNGWIEECCDVTPSLRAPTSDLYRSYKAWCERSGQGALGRKRFTQNMEQRGYRQERTNSSRCLAGITLKASAQDQGNGPPWYDNDR